MGNFIFKSEPQVPNAPPNSPKHDAHHRRLFHQPIVNPVIPKIVPDHKQPKYFTFDKRAR